MPNKKPAANIQKKSGKAPVKAAPTLDLEQVLYHMRALPKADKLALIKATQLALNGEQLYTFGDVQRLVAQEIQKRTNQQRSEQQIIEVNRMLRGMQR